MIFFPLCLYFFPLRPCNNCSTFTDGVLGGKYGKREIKSYFSRWTQSFFVTVSAYSNWGKIYDIFSPVSLFFLPVSLFFPSQVMQLIFLLSQMMYGTGGKYSFSLCQCFPPVSMFFPLCLYFFPLRPCNNCSTFTDGVLGENMARGKSNHIFLAGHNLFLRQYLRIPNGGKYMIFFHPCLYFFPPPMPCN